MGSQPGTHLVKTTMRIRFVGRLVIAKELERSKGAPPLLFVQLKLSEHQTSPPGYLTESELISLMEKHCIGTVSIV